jgi:flagellar protein FlgJ
MLGPERISRLAVSPLPPEAQPGATVNRAEKSADAARVKDMAKEFESTFLSMLLKEMRQTLEEDGGFFPGDTGDVQGGLFDLFLGKHLADAGGVGLAATLVQQMQPPTPITTTDAPARTDRPAGVLPPPTPPG